MATANAKETELLKNIVTDSATTGFTYVEKTLAEKLNKEGHVSINLKMVKGDTVAVAPSEKLKAAFPATPAATQRPKFVIEKGIPKPERKPSLRDGIYPFGDMEVGDSFVIPVSAQHPNPVKSFGSAVSSATRRYSTPHPTETYKKKNGEMAPKRVVVRKFSIVAAEGGARVYRDK